MSLNPLHVASATEPDAGEPLLVVTNISGGSAPLRQALRELADTVTTTGAILIRGEVGSGRKHLACALHERSARRHRAVVKIDCCAMTAGQVDRLLVDRSTVLKDAGTLVLAEIGALTAAAQAALSRALETRSFGIDVQVIATTSRDLQAEVSAGRFDAGLWQALSPTVITVPPLRAQPADIAGLAEHFMQRASRKLGRPFTRIDPATLMKLQTHAWPGNVAELQAVIERAAAQAETDVLVVNCPLGGRSDPSAAEDPTGEEEDLSLQAVERRHIIAVLKKTHGVIEGPRGAARILNLKPSTARFRMKKLGISRTDYV